MNRMMEEKLEGKRESDLMRLLHGELPEEQARALRARLDGDPALAEAYRRLGRTWEGLDLPPAPPAPLGFALRVTARAAAERTAQSAPAPPWVRAAAALALLIGAAVGVGVGESWPVPETTTQEQVRTVDQEELSAVDGSLAESWLTTLEDLEQ
jgi:anti-sigma factor RsiW